MHQKEKTIDDVVAKQLDITDADMDKIRQYCIGDVAKEDVFVFKAELCNNDLDRHQERFSLSALEDMAGLFVGKPIIKDHHPTADNQIARIYETYLEQVAGKAAFDGEPYWRVMAKCYTQKENEGLIRDIVMGIKKEGSVSFALGEACCSICGESTKKRCGHIPGNNYDGKRCYREIVSVPDVYEYSFVAIPAQRNAGVQKKYNPTPKGEEMTREQRKIKRDLDEACREIADLVSQQEGTLDATALSDALIKAAKLAKQAKDNDLETAEEKAAVTALADRWSASNSKGLAVIGKLIAGRSDKLTREEKQLITGDNAQYGENYLIPEDVKTAINELRRSYVSAKEYVTVSVTDSMAGSVNYEAGTPAGLTAFDDGDTIATEESILFKKISFAIKLYGKVIPVSNVLLGAASADILAYLGRWFVKNAVLSENLKIFETLKNGYNSGTPKAVTGWQGLKESIIKDIDPSCLHNGVVITNQSGFAALDAELDGNNRPILQPNPTKPTEFMFYGLPVAVFPDAQLANIDASHFPIIYGDTKNGCIFIEHIALQFAYSEHAGFTKNQNFMRVVEGFDVISTDTGAYVYGSYSSGSAAAADAAIETTSETKDKTKK